MGSNSQKTLILNTDFQPLAVVRRNRAIVLVLLQRAEIVATDGSYSHAERIMVENPSVVRLTKYVNIPYKSRRVPVTRRNVLARDNHTCGYCGRTATTVDHVVPRAQGGPHTWKNVAAACRPCNGRKRDRTPEEAGMPLRIKPYAPEGTGALLVLVGQVDENWREWLTERELASA